MSTQIRIMFVAEPGGDASFVVDECERNVGAFVGQCKWFNDKLGYGFVTVQEGCVKGKDIFVHHTGIRPLNSKYKTLTKGEYIHFNINSCDNGFQAVDVTGIGGGTLMCDVLPSRSSFRRRPVPLQPPPPPPPPLS